MLDASNAEVTLTLPSDREIVVARDLKAPATLVFDMWTMPEHVRRWYPCEGMTMPECQIDLRVGGRWRFVQRTESPPNQYALSGEYQVITRGERLVFSEIYEPIPGSDHLVEVTFQERAGITSVATRFEHPTKEGRDAHLRSGMESGLRATYQRIDELLKTLLHP